MFLFSVELLTLEQMGSLVALAKLCPALPTMLKSSTDVLLSVLDWCSYMGEGLFRCSLNLSPNLLTDTPVYSSSQSNLQHLNQYITPLFHFIVFLSMAATKMFFNILPLWKKAGFPHFCIFS